MMDVACNVIAKRSLIDLDPDYKDGHVSEVKRRCLVEESGQGQAHQRLVEVVVHELDSALEEKESEALQLQERVQDCQRALRLLRFAVTSTYYKNIPTSETSVDSLPDTEGQNALHPTVMRFLKFTTAGSGPRTRGVRNKHSSEGQPEVVQDTPSFQEDSSDTERKCRDESNDQEKARSSANDNEEKKVKEKSVKKEEATQVKMPRYIPPILPDPPAVCAASARMERHRIKRRLVVGNISKWLPEDVREDAASHKWMLYLRGPRDSPEISDIVAKVRYFLHPSYRPHDIVEVVAPFYLSRRGWGEFPVRVQVHFAIPGNQPIDIIHYLKLDRTYSGLQTLGGETVVDVWLKNAPSMQNVEQSSVQFSQQNAQKLSSAEKQTTIFSDGQHEIMIHDPETPLTEVAMQEIYEKVKVKEELREEEEHQSRKNLEKNNEEKNLQAEPGEGEFQKNEKEKEEQLEQANCKIKITSGDIQIKSENVQLENKAKIKTCSPIVDSGKPFLSCVYVFHTLPDHDYLGNKPFKLKCTMCVDKSHLRSVSKVKPFREVAQRAIFNGGTLVKAAKTETVAKVDNGLCSESLMVSNGTVSSTSLVQCVDSKGNLLYIDLQRPTSKYEIRKGLLANSSFAQWQYPTCDVADNVSLYSSDAKMKISDSKILIKNVQISPSTSVHAGRSLLKKNYLVPPSPLSSELCHMSGPSDAVQPKLILANYCARPQKFEFKPVPKNLVKEARHVVPKISDDCRAVIWLLRQLPLTDKRVNKDLEFKKKHPYCASSTAAFLAWPVGKRHCAERLRAKEAHGILQTIDSNRFAKWTVRHIITLSRLHALTLLPLRKCKDLLEPKNVVSALRSTVSEPSEVQDWLESVAEASKTAEEMEEVNVVDLPAPTEDMKTTAHTERTSDCVTVWMRSKSNLNHFLRETVGQLDIRLVTEALTPGALYPAAEELLYSACLSFSEDLLRRSVHQAWKRCQQVPNEIVLLDVQNALLSRSEFDLFTNSGLGVQAYASKFT